ncbi:MAG: Gfo/Idh/MocA family oxidoreductase [Sedimentisphaerales bacterium]|nr:Gfo/Idh/MocA family oxidoreductase [Sedimentisphaerales bacterium]
MERRDFLKKAAVTGAAAITASSMDRIYGAGSKVNIALIGCGSQGTHVARLINQAGNVEYIAFCDVYERNAQRAKTSLGPNAKIFRDFRKVLEEKDIDAVHIGTPDHWHALIAIAALEAGKHVYCEKPIEHTIQEGLAIVEASKKYPKCIFLTGTQHRSAPHIMRAAEMVQSGAIGEVHFVSVWNYSNSMPNGIGTAPDSKPPEDLDWDFYLGPAPMVPYNPLRVGPTYRSFRDYSSGRVADYGVHRFDSVHQIMGDEKPLSCNCSAYRYCLGGMGDHPDVMQATFEYKNWIMSYETLDINSFGSMARTTAGLPHHGASQNGKDRPNGMMFFGTKATLIVDRRATELIPEPRNSNIQPVAEGNDVPDALHAQHFIRCIRDGEKVRTDALTGHRAGNICHLANISSKTGRKIKWDPEKEVIIDDPEASKLIGKKARSPWDKITI